ncbi:MAG: winged helix DNA-binding domain-containing protein, partial [Actinomycetota bacterium]|nr:winged helix DNA-binding domain-containing protein [Actinomycetota bacterium]
TTLAEARKHKEMRAVLDRLAEGPATATELGGAKRGGIWWDWSDVKMAAESLLRSGHVVCIERRGWKRVYDLTERVIPPELLAIEPTAQECRVELVARAGRHLGVATRADLADYHRLLLRAVDAALPESGLVPVEVEGWNEPAWADPAALAAQSSGAVRGRHRTTLLSPFDPMVWDRARTERMFGLSHRLEAYTPKPKRVFGYFAMPVLAGGRLVGRVDPSRSGKTFVANLASIERGGARSVAAVADAIVEAAAWVGSTSVVIDRVEPAALTDALRAEVATQAG